MANTPFFSGKSTFWTILLGQAKLTVFVKQWSFGPDVTKINDGVCGENRDRLDRIVNYYSGSITTWSTDASAIIALLGDIANDDGNVAPIEKGAGITIKPNDGSKSSFVLDSLVIDDWKLQIGGRTDRFMIDLPMRCQDMRQTKGI